LDYDIDTRLGEWLRARRIDLHLSVSQVSERSGLGCERILEIETGTFSRGITKAEALAFAECYFINLSEIIGRAIS
jgi:transcriptional regulator with XRE-family HTH domain